MEHVSPGVSSQRGGKIDMRMEKMLGPPLRNRKGSADRHGTGSRQAWALGKAGCQVT